MPSRLVALAAAALLLSACGSEPEAWKPDGRRTLTESTTLTADGVIPDPDLRGAIVIETDDVVLDLGGHALLGAPQAHTPETPAPDGHRGIGILVRNAKNVTIRNGKVAGYKVGIRAEHAPGLVVEDVDASWNWRKRLQSTPEREHIEDWLWPHYNEDGEWERKYGGAISLVHCKDAVVRRCRVHFGQNGVLLTHCRRCRVYDNDLRFNSGWGIALFRTHHSEVSHNRCDFCVRGFVHGVYHRGQDSAGIVVFEQSHHNVIAKNSATHCGNGLFLYAGHSTTEDTGQGGSNDCVVVDNDFRFAVANGIEATFAQNNVYLRNDCSGGEHGIWAGYSQRCLFLDNKASDCKRIGIAIEHGNDNVIARNEIRGGGTGIDLWWDPDPKFVDGVFGQHQDTSSARNRLIGNTITGGKIALRLAGDKDAVIVDNEIGAQEALVRIEADGRPALVARNRLQGDTKGKTLPRVDGAKDLDVSVPSVDIPPTTGSQDTTWQGPAGREHIRIGPWGPLDPRDDRRGQPGTPLIFPAILDRGVPTGRFYVGGFGPFTIETEGDVEVTPMKGQAPTRIDVVAGSAPGLHPFTVTALFGDKRVTASGTLLRVNWRVEFWTWRVDPREGEQAYRDLLATEPHVRLETSGLHFPWYADGPEGIPNDRFVTRATATVQLPAGKYKVHTVSDDGVRVYVNDERVIDHWTHHAPEADDAIVTLAAGEHTFRVEHFELTGWAFLTLALQRIP